MYKSLLIFVVIDEASDDVGWIFPEVISDSDFCQIIKLIKINYYLLKNSVNLVNSVLSLPTELITSIAIYHVVLSITDCILTLIS